MTATRWLAAMGSVLATLFAMPSYAQSTSDRASPGATSWSSSEMTRQMRGYFRGELDLASAAMGLGAGSGYAGGMLLAQATDASRAAAVPVLTVGLLEVVIGVGLLVRTGPQVRELESEIERSPEGYAKREGERMEAVVSRFTLFRTIEAILLVGGAGTAALGAVVEEDLAVGAGLGLGTQAAVVLVIDAFAEMRASRYLDDIRAFQLTPSVTPTAQGVTVYSVTLGGAF